ncbi:MAG TPA: restriction endonuclease [Candidatus Competibacteraceae bacterium]|nr:MAG: restriction endonuclease [Candidatus Competibacteraceae bacterium]HQC72207.1 restriction endonuclease [Candidatus Competibacteraceae bacterium]
MAIPSYDSCIYPLLQTLAAYPDGARVSELQDRTADRLGLSAEERAEILPSGAQMVFRNRIGWAHDRLKRQQLSESPRRGWWRITPTGRLFLAAHPDGIDDALRLRLARLSVTDNGDMASHSATDSVPDSSPEERIDAAVKELHDSVARDLLEHIGQCTPAFFERLVLDLLHALGYGVSRSDLRQTGGPGDGGIDGIIALDRLGLEKVYVQAKRWQSTIGSPQLHEFYGALAARKARKGVFITTSDFSTQAREFSRSVADGIVLVNGADLARFMIETGVGVTVKRQVHIVSIDSDYFEDL